MGSGSEGSKLRQEKESNKDRSLALSVISWRTLEHELHHRVIPTLRQERADFTCLLISLVEIIASRPFPGDGAITDLPVYLSFYLPTGEET